jgi:hypothetical protein
MEAGDCTDGSGIAGRCAVPADGHMERLMPQAVVGSGSDGGGTSASGLM